MNKMLLGLTACFVTIALFSAVDLAFSTLQCPDSCPGIIAGCVYEGLNAMKVRSRVCTDVAQGNLLFRARLDGGAWTTATRIVYEDPCVSPCSCYEAEVGFYCEADCSGDAEWWNGQPGSGTRIIATRFFCDHP